MTKFRRTLLVLVVVGALAPAAPAAAKTVPSNLRIEGPGITLDPGTTYFTDTVRTRTSTRSECAGSGDQVELAGPNAMGIVSDAADARRSLRPVRVSDKFPIGLIICGIGDFIGFEDSFWLFKVNHVAPDLGADQVRLRRGDEVLWYFVEDGAINSGNELDLHAPARVEPGEPFEVTVTEFGPTGAESPAAGASVGGVTTDPAGHATLAVDEGLTRLRATRGNDIASPPVEVCSGKGCPRRRGEEIVGTDRADDISGTRGPDEIRARGGADEIDAEGGGADEVNCGGGKDVVRVDGRDEAGRSCERVRR